jgi:DNA repair ATPase RecN
MPITIFPPIPSITTSTTLATNASQELNGQLQRVADLMEASLLELRVISTSIAQLNDGSGIDPEQLRSDVSLPNQ